MKYLILLSLFLSFSSFAISHKEFVKLKRSEREEVIKAYKKFLAAYSEAIKVSSAPRMTLPDFISAAYASDYNCVYAGWPSNRVSGLCSTPRSNPAFQRESCGQNQMPCQPILFGRGLCVPTSTRDQRRSAFANCQRKFSADGRSLAQVVEYISDPELASQADELFRLVDEICTTGAQASTPMCRSLKARVESIKSQRPAEQEEATPPTPPEEPREARVESAPPQEALTVAAEEAAQINNTVENLNNSTQCISCESQREQTVDEPERAQVRRHEEPSPHTPFPRIVSGYTLASCSSGQGTSEGYNIRRVRNCQGNDPGAHSGWNFGQDRNTHPHLSGVQSPYPGYGLPTRSWELVSRNSAFNETYLVMEESAGGPDSHNVKSYMFVIPRVTVPSVRTEGNNIIATLQTGETVTMDKRSRAITGGALSEGPIDLNTDRFQRRPPNIHYSGSGISIRLNHRYEHPLTSAETAVVKQGSRTCNVPRSALLDSEGRMITTSDADLLAVINRSCRGGGFTLP